MPRKNFEVEEFTEQDRLDIRFTAYSRYQYSWLIANGFTMENMSTKVDEYISWKGTKEGKEIDLDFYDYLRNTGINSKGEIFLDYDEFINSIYPDEEFIMNLFSANEYLMIMYYLDIGGDEEEVQENETDDRGKER